MPQPSSPVRSAPGLLRLYYQIVLTVVAAVITLMVLTRLVLGGAEVVTPPRLALYGGILLLSWFGHELVRHSEEDAAREPTGVLLGLLGLLQVVLCVETGGLASAYYMLVACTCIFGALTMRPAKAFLLTSLVAATYCAATWLYPAHGGLVEEGLDGLLSRLRSGHRANGDEVTALVVHCGFLFVGTWIAIRVASGLRERVVRLETTANRDPLTGLPNRRGLGEKLAAEFARARQYDWPIAFLLVDLDHFKRVNDRFGHPVGDKTLVASARLVREATGPLDHVARVGGEEFAVAAVGVDRRHGADLADRIVRAFRAFDWETVHAGLEVTCSVGVAVGHPGRTGGGGRDEVDLLAEEADRALLLVKAHGRNGFLVSGDATAGPTAPGGVGAGSPRTAGV